MKNFKTNYALFSLTVFIVGMLGFAAFDFSPLLSVIGTLCVHGIGSQVLFGITPLIDYSLGETAIATLKKGAGGQSSDAMRAQASATDAASRLAANVLKYLPTPPHITDFTFSIANAHATDSETVVLWNPSTIVTGLTQGADITTTTDNGSDGATYANFIKLLIDNSFTIKGWTWNVEAQSQFTKAFVVYVANGSGIKSPTPINSYIAQVQYFYANQSQIVVPYPQKLDQRVAWTISQSPDSTMTMAFQVLPGSQVGYGS